MSDKDTRAKGRFEPPPWEREAFDALAARRAEEQSVAEALEAAVAKEPEKPADPREERPDTPAEAPEAAKNSPAAPMPEGGAARPAATVDEKAVQAMLAQLQAEERTDGSSTKWVGWAASAVTFALGLGMVVFGLVAVRGGEAKSANLIGSAVLAVFGLCFMGMAAWVWISTNRSKGRR